MTKSVLTLPPEICRLPVPSTPMMSWLLPLPFYFMELLVGLVQAMVFMLLTAVFTLLICQHHESPETPLQA